MLMLNRHFNPAGVPFKDGSDTIIISQFDVREKDAAVPVTAAPAGADQEVPF